METLPVELLVRVIEELWEDKPDNVLPCAPSPLDRDSLLQNLKSVRLVNNVFKAAAFRVFRDAFFTKRTIVMDKRSLTKLMDLTASDLGNKLDTLIISTYQFLPSICESKVAFEKHIRKHKNTEHTYLKQIGDEFDAKRIAVALKAYRRYLKEQGIMRKTAADSAMLARALGNVRKSLMSVCITGFEPSCGSRAIARDVGVTHHVGDFPASIAKEVVSVVVRAIYWSRIELCQLKFTCLSLGALQLSDGDYYHLKRSNIHLHGMDLAVRQSENDDREALEDDALGTLIRTARHLTSLALRFPEFQPYPFALRSLVGTRHMLTCLELEGLTVQRNDLFCTLIKLRHTLCSISLRTTFLRTGTWRKMFEWMHKTLALSDFAFHVIWDTDEELHTATASLKDYMTNVSDEFDWTDMKGEIKPSEIAVLQLGTDSDWSFNSGDEGDDESDDESDVESDDSDESESSGADDELGCE